MTIRMTSLKPRVTHFATQTTAPSYRELEPAIFSSYPRLTPAAIQSRLETLTEDWDEKRYSTALWHYNNRRKMAAVTSVAGSISTTFAIGGLFAATLLDLANFPAYLRALAGLVLIAGCAIPAVILVRFPASAARWQFFRQLGRAIRTTRDAKRYPDLDVELTAILNRLGKAACLLRISLQGNRRPWISPPMVSDRALRLTSPLIDIKVPDDLHLQSVSADASRDLFRGFLHDVATVVAIGREDLIPRVRSAYPQLARRQNEPTAQDRDLDYLDPLRSRTRLDVLKDFWYPLAQWFSLLTAVTVVVINLIR